MQQQKVALFCHSAAKGGLELNIHKLAQAFRSSGRGVLVIGLDQSPLEALCQSTGLAFVPLRLRNKRLDLLAARHMAWLLEQYQIHHLVTATSQHNYIAAFAKAFFAKGLRIHYYQQMQLGGPKKGLLQNWVHSKLDTWFAPLEGLKQQALNWTKLSPQQIEMAPLGVDWAHFAQFPLDKATCRVELSLPLDTCLIGLIGRLDPLKKQSLLIEALANCKAPITVLLLGEETLDNRAGYAEEIQGLVKHHQLEDRLILRPFEADVRPYLRAMDALVMATSKETYGMVTVEAMAMGTPVIGANGGGTPELLEEGKAGTLFEPDNAASLAEAMEQVYHNPETAKAKAAQAQARAREQYGMDKTLAAFEGRLGK